MRRCDADYLRALWPAFLVALAASGVMFSALDPVHHAPTALAHWPPALLYSLGFFGQWLACWTASALNLWLLARRPPGAGDVFEDRSDPQAPAPGFRPRG